MRPELTAKQQRFLNYLQQSIADSGGAPSLRQAAADLGISHAAVAQLLQALEKKGFVKRDGRYSRKIYLLNESAQTIASQRYREIPVIGRIQAGMPMYAQQEWDGSVVIDRTLFKGENLFALRVKGNSMQEAGIFAGDLVVCEPRQYAADGEIIVALINNEEATVKRFFLHADHIELRPENSAYATMTYNFSEVMVQGKVIGVMRDHVAGQ